MKIVKKLILGGVFIFFLGCDYEIEKGVMKSDLSKDVELITDFGTIVFRLSNDTPKHRNNFIKLVNQKSYDNVSFHRVIENFLIQTGNMDTKYPDPKQEKDSSEQAYTIDAEVRPNLFHMRGAINAARMGDDYNPNRSSSGTQFTIIQGKPYNDSTLAVAEKRINTNLAYHRIINKPEHKTEFNKLFKLSNKMEDIAVAEDVLDSEVKKIMLDSIQRLKNKFDSLARVELIKMKHYSFPEKHREIYKTLGGAAHLDQNYTVFGMVVKGMNIVDSIAAVKTNKQDKPIKDIRIISAKMIERK
ncbi:peptidylprolyl isomerase [Algibacter pacificus]|uniref:peptidylprolyl isomerase n=1 Tax=Algibacter pacificus TaxID=2599389 RepID=UPI0011CBC3A4|nr:peptidylprolyl isomerase [Algibacter pacificus]